MSLKERMAKMALAGSTGGPGGGPALEPAALELTLSTMNSAKLKHRRQSSNGPLPDMRPNRSRSVSVVADHGHDEGVAQALMLFERYSINYDTTEGIDLNGFLLFAETAGLLPSAAAETEGYAGEHGFLLSRADGILVFSQAKLPKRDTLTLRSFQDACAKLAEKAGEGHSYEGLLATVTQVLEVSDAQYHAAAAEAGGGAYYEGFGAGHAEEDYAEEGYAGYAGYEGGAIEEEEEEEGEEDGAIDGEEGGDANAAASVPKSKSAVAESRLKRLSVVAPNQLTRFAADEAAEAEAAEARAAGAVAESGGATANPYSRENYYADGAPAAMAATAPAPPALTVVATVPVSAPAGADLAGAVPAGKKSKKGKKTRPAPPTAAAPTPRGYEQEQKKATQQNFAVEAMELRRAAAAAAEAAEEQLLADEKAAAEEAARAAEEAEVARLAAAAKAAADAEEKLERKLAAEQDIRARAALKIKAAEEQAAAAAAERARLAALYAKQEEDKELARQRDAEAKAAWAEVAARTKEAEHAAALELRREPNRCAVIMQRAARMLIARVRVQNLFEAE